MSRAEPEKMETQAEVPAKEEVPAAEIMDAPTRTFEDRVSSNWAPSEPPSIMVEVPQDPTEALAEDLDPLGIGDVKDHVPQSKRAQTAMERRKEQMELLMK
jgi:proline-rich tail region repeat protein